MRAAAVRVSGVPGDLRFVAHWGGAGAGDGLSGEGPGNRAGRTPGKAGKAGKSGEKTAIKPGNPGEKTAGKPRLLEIDDALVEFAVEELPAMGRRDTRGALENLAAGHVPGSMDEYAMDYLIDRPTGGTRRAVMVIIRREILHEIRRSHPLTPIAVPGAVLRLSAEGGSPDESPGGSRGKPGRPNESPGGSRGKPGRPGGPGRPCRELFPPKGGRPVDRLLPAALLLLLIAGGLSLRAEEHRSRGRRLTAEAREQAMRRDSAAARELQTRLNALETEWNRLIRARPRRLSRLFATLARDADTPITIRKFTVNGRRFYFRGEAADPLALARALEASPAFSQLRITDIRPGKSGGPGNFAMEGYYHGD